MTLRRKGRRHTNTPKLRSWALGSSAVVILTGFVWWLVQWFTFSTMGCEGYYAFWTTGQETKTSLLIYTTVLTFAVSLWWLFEALRPKQDRHSFLVRVFQGLILVSMTSSMLIQWGLLYPEGRVFPVANHALGGLQTFFFRPAYPFESSQLEDGSWIEIPVDYNISTLEWSEFRRIDGRLACLVERERLEAQDQAWRDELWLIPSDLLDIPDR